MQHALHLAELSAPTRAHRLNTQQLHRSRHCSMPAGTPSSSSAEVGTVACWQAARAPRNTAAAPHAAALPAALFARGCRAVHLTRGQQHPLACSCWMPQQPRIKSCDQMDSRGWCSGTSRRQVSPPEAARHTVRPQRMLHCRSGSRWWSPAWRPLPLPGWHQRPASLTRPACPESWPGVAPTQQGSKNNEKVARPLQGPLGAGRYARAARSASCPIPFCKRGCSLTCTLTAFEVPSVTICLWFHSGCKSAQVDSRQQWCSFVQEQVHHLCSTIWRLAVNEGQQVSKCTHISAEGWQTLQAHLVADGAGIHCLNRAAVEARPDSV